MNNMFIIWIGDKPAPIDNIESWKDKHTNWKFRLVGNEELLKTKWVNKGIIKTYLKEKRYAGVADVIRYELLYREGGFCPPADSYCLENTDELFEGEAFAVYENEIERPGLLSPLYACKKGNDFAKKLVYSLPKFPPKINGRSKAPFSVTGNRYMKEMVKKHKPIIKIFPSHYFIPVHHTGRKYKGNGKVYAVQLWGTTNEWKGKKVDYLKLWNQ